MRLLSAPFAATANPPYQGLSDKILVKEELPEIRHNAYYGDNNLTPTMTRKRL